MKSVGSPLSDWIEVDEDRWEVRCQRCGAKERYTGVLYSRWIATQLAFNRFHAECGTPEEQEKEFAYGGLG